MSGWLKMESSTPDKPEVLAITVKMGWDDPDLTVGKLFRVWKWFDQHTVDGNAPSVTPALLDRIVGVSGFVTAMSEVGWLVISDDGVSLPNFDRHNGATAKKRALTAKRVANHKTALPKEQKSNAPSVSDALPREEKKREDIDIKEKNIKKEKRACQIPDDFELNEKDIQFAIERNVNHENEFLTFKNFHISKGNVMKDWRAAWRTWCLNSLKYPKASARASPANPKPKKESLYDKNYSEGMNENGEIVF